MHLAANENYSLHFMRLLGSAHEGGSTTWDDESWYRVESRRGCHMKLHRKEHHMKIDLSGPTEIVPRPTAGLGHSIVKVLAKASGTVISNRDLKLGKFRVFHTPVTSLRC